MSEHTGVAYALFEAHMRAGLALLRLPPQAISTRLKYTHLPTFPNPVESFELSAEFPGALCLISFGESVVDPTFFFAEMELRRAGQPTLFIRDYLAAHKDSRLDVLRFNVSQTSLEQGIEAIRQALMSLLDKDLLPLLEGRTWMTAPFEWGDHK